MRDRSGIEPRAQLRVVEQAAISCHDPGGTSDKPDTVAPGCERIWRR